MPVYLEWVEQPSEQDWIDLGKLYKEVPGQWYSDYGVETVQDYVAAHGGDDQRLLAAGRFNDRLITTASLVPVEQGYAIQHLAVRAVTQGRGVARQLVVRLAQWADANQITLVVNADEPELSKLTNKLEEHGFSAEQGCWVRQPA